MPTLAILSALLALLAAVTYGAADFLGGLAGRRIPTIAVVLWSQAMGWMLALMAALVFPAISVLAIGVWWGAAGGLVGTVGLFALYHGLAVARMCRFTRYTRP